MAKDKYRDRLKLYHQGLNDSAIADMIGITQEGVSAWRRRQGLPPNKRRRHLKDNRLELYKQGLSDEQIARKLNLSTTSITSWRSRRGLDAINGIYDMEIGYSPQTGPKGPQGLRGISEKNKIKDNRLELYKRGLSDEDIAQKVGVTKRAIASWRYRRRLKANIEPRRKEP